MCTFCLIYLFGMVLGWGSGVGLGLDIDRALVGALNFVYVRYTIKNIKTEFKT